MTETSETNQKAIHILMVEDNEDDAEISLRAFEESKTKAIVHVAPNGEEAIQYLNREGVYADEVQYPTPCLVFLDVNLPKLDGFQVLIKIRSIEKYKELPIFMLTSSKNEQDISRSYDGGVSGYIQKPIYAKEVSNILKQFESS